MCTVNQIMFMYMYNCKYMYMYMSTVDKNMLCTCIIVNTCTRTCALSNHVMYMYNCKYMYVYMCTVDKIMFMYMYNCICIIVNTCTCSLCTVDHIMYSYSCFSCQVKPLASSHNKPVIVFINPKSGGNEGAKIMRVFQWFLNPRQVFDLTQGGPKFGLVRITCILHVRICTCICITCMYMYVHITCTCTLSGMHQLRIHVHSHVNN